jgi:2-dehydropantoate 2-reductase
VPAVKVLIAGAGGVGGYFGGRLAARGHEVWFLSRGEKLRALREHGLEIRSDHGDARLPSVNAVGDAAGVGPVDAVLFCVKAYDNSKAADSVAAAVAPGTSITSLQNGVENEGFLSSRFPEAVVLGGVARIEAWVESPSVIVQRGQMTNLTVGAFGPGERPHAEALDAAFKGTDVTFNVSDDIESALWYKLMTICCVGGVTAYCRCPIGRAREDEELRALMAAVLREVGDVAGARGVALPPHPEATLLRYFDEKLDPGFKSSMCRDVEAGRPLEIEALNAAVVRFGEGLGVSTPGNRTIAEALLPLHEHAMNRRPEFG